LLSSVVLTHRRAFVVGTVSLDVVFEDVAPGAARVAVGNSGVNIAIRLAALGWEVQFCGLIGLDQAGSLVSRDLQRWRVNVDGLVRRRGYATPHVFQRIEASGVPAEYSNECPVCGWKREPLEAPRVEELPDQILEYARTAELFVTDLPAQLTLSLARRAQGVVWYEASLREFRGSDATRLAALCHVLKASEDELSDYVDAFGTGGERCELQIVTEGSRGSRYRQREPSRLGWGEWIRAAAAHVDRLVDPGGAGDAFTAATAAELAGSFPPWSKAVVENALNVGSRRAAEACERYGARGDMSPPGRNSLGESVWISENHPVGCPVCLGRRGT
jgi:sugar/nucleoside kinase (ribokinase family)